MNNPTLKALMDTTDILMDAIKCLRALEYDTVADILVSRMLEAQENIYGGDPTIKNGGNLNE
tara:strand:+ start:748 stop:933 length:186 start_codon:yes stop_codon:yes gene_type:complete